MPPHFAISEAFIVIAAIFCGWKLFKSGQYMGALGVLLFGAAASIGVYRFPSGQVQELASLHKWSGQMGGLAGMGLIALALFERTPIPKAAFVKLSGFMLLVIMLVMAQFNPVLAVPFFLFCSMMAIGAALGVPAKSIGQRFLFPGAASLMLLNVIFIRQSAHLDPNVGWHLFHTLIAVWIVAMYWILTQGKTLEN